MKKIVYIILAVFLVNTSCNSDKTLEELSVDPNDPVTVKPTLILTAAQTSILGEFGYNWDRYAGTFVQTFAGNHSTGVDADRYNLNSSDFEGNFLRMYSRGFIDCKKLIEELGPAEEAWQHVGVAKILMATGLGALTTIYGDIPYSEAFTDALNPKYDSQEEIYNTVLTLLEEGIADLDKTSGIDLGPEDLVYGGDVDKWKGAAYTLLARYTNHFSKKGSYDTDKVLGYVASAKATGMSSNAGNYIMNHDDQDSNWRNPWYNLYRNNLIIASENFMNSLLEYDHGKKDPRVYAYFDTKSVNGADVGLVGKPNGDPTSNAMYSPVGPQGYYGKIESPQLIATYYELLFIEAEAKFSKGDAEGAATAMAEAMQAQFDMVKQDAYQHASRYDGISLSDATAMIEGLWADYMINFGNGSPTGLTIEKIMTEKYRAMFTLNLETWNDLRRYDFSYPSYLSLPNEVFLNTYIKRGLYTQSELDNNSNTPQDVTMTQDLWIFSN